MINFRFYDKPKKYSWPDKLIRSILKRLLRIRLLSTIYFRNNQQQFEQIISSLNSENGNHDKIIYFHHDLGGGSDFYVLNKVNELKDKNYIFVIIYKPNLKKINLQIDFKEKHSSVLFDDLNQLANFFEKIRINIIYISHLILFPKLEEAFGLIKRLRREKTKVINLIHDFNNICVRLFLLKEDGSSCDIIDGKKYCICDQKSGYNFNQWSKFLKSEFVDEIICFSQNSKEIITKIEHNLNNKIKVIPHHVPRLERANNATKGNQTINIATIGSLNKLKGCEIVREMAEIITKEKLAVKITSIGQFHTRKNKIIKVIGRYKRNDLPKIVEDNQIDIVLIPSICHETFSYATQESIMMGLKVACFNLGAQAEYVKNYQQGLIISKIDAKIALEEIINYCQKK